MVHRYAEQLGRSRAQRHLLFSVATLIVIACTGYYFGTFDQAIHIPFLKKFADPSLYPDDPYFEMRFQHYSYFWMIWQPFYRLGFLEIALFVGHMGATYLTFWAIWTLSDTLFHNPLASLLGVLTFTMPHIGFGGFPVIEFSLLNRTFVLPFLLWTLVLYLRKRYLLAYLALGVLYNLHVVSVNFGLSMFLLDSLLEVRRIGWKKIALGIVLFLTGAAPVLIWKASGPRIELAQQQAWLSTVSAQLYHLYYPFGPYLHVIGPTLCGISALTMFWLTRHDGPTPHTTRTVTHFMCAVSLLVLAQVLAAWLFPMTIVMQLQIVRAGLFALVFGYLYFAHHVTKHLQAGTMDKTEGAILAGVTIAVPFPLGLAIVWGLARWARTQRWRQVALAALVVVLSAGSLVVAIQYGAWKPGIHVFGPHNAWYEAQVWARDHTPREALFITPPQKWDFYDSDWRVFSERSTVATLSELLEIALVPDYLDEWLARFDPLAPGARAQFGGDYFENRRLTAEAFYSLRTDELQRIGEQYGASYLVVEKPHQHDLPVAYENDAYTIYVLGQ